MNIESLKKVLDSLREIKASMHNMAETCTKEKLDEAIEVLIEILQEFLHTHIILIVDTQCQTSEDFRRISGRLGINCVISQALDVEHIKQLLFELLYKDKNKKHSI